MHAVVIEVDIHDREAAQQELTERLVPTVSQAPGFVAGYWIAVGENNGVSVVVFDEEEHAKAMAEMARGNAPAQVTMRNVTTGPVVASA
jgi:hypothetical protein